MGLVRSASPIWGRPSILGTCRPNVTAIVRLIVVDGVAENASLRFPYIVIDDLPDLVREFDGQLIRVDRGHGALTKHGMRDQFANRKLASGCVVR